MENYPGMSIHHLIMIPVLPKQMRHLREEKHNILNLPDTSYSVSRLDVKTGQVYRNVFCLSYVNFKYLLCNWSGFRERYNFSFLCTFFNDSGSRLNVCLQFRANLSNHLKKIHSPPPELKI